MGQVRGIVLHGTRSGRAGNPSEGTGTVNYCLTPGTTSYNWILDYDGTVYELVPPGVAAWHAGFLNHNFLGLAFAQPTASDPITDAQHASARWLIARESARYGFPAVRKPWLSGTSTWGIGEHMTSDQGAAFGKSDVGNLDWSRILP